MGKKIGMLLDAFYPSDIRVHKEAKTLIEEGFEVFLLCKRRKEEKYKEVVGGIQVVRIDAGVGEASKGILDILLAVNFVHPIFKRKLSHFIDSLKIDVLHVHDLPLVKTAVLVAKRKNVNVVADLHENYPEALRVWFQWKRNPLIRLKNRVFFNYERWNRYEKWVTQNVDGIIAVVEEMKNRLIYEHELPASKVIVVTNTETKGFIDSKLNKNIYDEDKNKFILAYTGGVGPHRGVDTAIEAMSLLKDYKDIILYVTGSVSKAAENEMLNLIDKFDLEGTVKILGYRPFSEFYSFMKMASINVIPHHSNGHTDNTVPHKLFQCMMTSVPLLVSSSAPLKRIVEETQSGLVFEAGNPNDFANKVLELYSDSEKRTIFGSNGFDSTLNGNYNWESTSKFLKDFYEGI